MSSIGKIGVIIQKDLRNWVRNPFLIIIGIVPLLLILIFIGFFLTQAESLPTGIILQDNDPFALEIQDYVSTVKSGSGTKWFEVENLSQSEVLAEFEAGNLLCYISVPTELTTKLASNHTVVLNVYINNINDDVTKNVIQRIREVCNHFNSKLNAGSLTFNSPIVEYSGIVPVDISFTHYVCGSICALSIILSAGVNVATSTSFEFEKKTSKELIMGGSPTEVITGKVIVSVIQTFIIFSVILLLSYLFFGFTPNGNIFFILFLVLWGALTFSSLGFLMSVLIQQSIPAAIAILTLNMLGWWIGGGLVPSEITTGLLNKIAVIWPGTYFYRMFTNSVLLGWIATPTLWVDFLVTGLFGVITYVIAITIFVRRIKS